MKLASGKISNPVTIKAYVNDQVMFRSDYGNQYVNMIYLKNVSALPVTFTLSVLYGKDKIVLLGPSYSLSAGSSKPVFLKIYLDEFDEIRCSTSSNEAIQYIINGGNVEDESKDPSFNFQVDPSDISSSGNIDSDQILKLIPSADENQNEKVYNQYALVQNVARADAVDAKNYLIDIREPANINVTDGGLAGNSVFNDYVNIRGINRKVKLILANQTYINTAGTVLIENVNIVYINAGSGTPKFKGQLFKDVYFNFDCTSIEFEDCKFEGVNYIKMAAGTLIFTTSTGGIIVTNAPHSSADVWGWFGKSITNF